MTGAKMLSARRVTIFIVVASRGPMIDGWMIYDKCAREAACN